MWLLGVVTWLELLSETDVSALFTESVLRDMTLAPSRFKSMRDDEMLTIDVLISDFTMRDVMLFTKFDVDMVAGWKERKVCICLSNKITNLSLIIIIIIHMIVIIITISAQNPMLGFWPHLSCLHRTGRRIDLAFRQFGFLRGDFGYPSVETTSPSE